MSFLFCKQKLTLYSEKGEKATKLFRENKKLALILLKRKCHWEGCLFCLWGWHWQVVFAVAAYMASVISVIIMFLVFCESLPTEKLIKLYQIKLTDKALSLEL